MMKAELSFDLPEEQTEFMDALNGCKYKDIILELFNWINREQDYPTKGLTHEQLEVFRSVICEKLSEYEVEVP